MASMRDIKSHKVSIHNTQQITKAMELVSTVKLQKAKARTEQSKPYFDYMYETISSMLSMSGDINHPYLTAGDSHKKAIIVITSNRGLAGGYNTHVTKLITHSNIAKEDVYIYAIGRKGKEYLERRGYEIKADYSEIINEPIYNDAKELAKEVLELFAKGEIGEIYLTYTAFKNTVVHTPIMMKLLPVQIKEEPNKDAADKKIRMSYEPTEKEVFYEIIPIYITSLIYGALVEATASENAARMQAMDAATNNAEEMIEELSLKYNRVRQGAITEELTEIISGANAIG